MRRTVWIVWTPLAFALSQVLRHSLDETAPVSLSMGLRPLVFMTALTLLLLWALKFLIPGLAKRAVILTAFYILFLNYTLFVRLLGIVPPLRPLARLGLTDAAVAFGLVAAAMTAIIVIVRRSKSEFSTSQNALGVFTTALVVLVLVQSMAPFVDGSRNRWLAAADRIIDTAATADIHPAENLPDIYYIILDGYAREDVLRTLYNYDNSEFLGFLGNQGFQTLGQSNSNYPQTYLSLASSLNLSYLDELSTVVTPESNNRRPLRYLIQHNSAAQLLRRAGYSFVYIASVFSGTSDNVQADVCLCRPPWLGQVENQILFHTPLALVRPIQILQHDDYRRRTLATLDDLRITAILPGPKFVFAHVLFPHPPFVIGSAGDAVTPRAPLMLNDGSYFPLSSEEYAVGYVNQLRFLNSKLIEAVGAILALSPTPPVIILQADHGPGLMLDWDNVENSNATERLGILASYLVPGDLSIQISETMTPVNTFPILFNAILGTGFDLAENHSYLATWAKPYDFVPVAPSTEDAQARSLPVTLGITPDQETPGDKSGGE